MLVDKEQAAAKWQRQFGRPCGANRAVFAFGRDSDRSVIRYFGPHDHLIAIIERLQKSNLHRAMFQPLGRVLHDRNRHVAVDRDAGHQPAAKSILRGHAVVMNLVFGIRRCVDGAHAMERQRPAHTVVVSATRSAYRRST